MSRKPVVRASQNFLLWWHCDRFILPVL